MRRAGLHLATKVGPFSRVFKDGIHGLGAESVCWPLGGVYHLEYRTCVMFDSDLFCNLLDAKLVNRSEIDTAAMTANGVC